MSLSQLVVFHKGLSENQVSRTLIIPADLDIAAVWMVSILPLMSNSSSLFS